MAKWSEKWTAIPWRNWMNRRITESQSRHINWFGMYAVNNNNTGTCTSDPSFLQRLSFTLFMTQFGRLPIVGFSFFAPLRKWTFGAGYNHQAVVLQPFFLNLDHFSLLLLFSVCWVGTHNKDQLKAVVQSQKH